MYEWIEDVDKVIQGLKGERNNIDTRIKVTKDIIAVLDKHEVQAFIDCSAQVNNADVVNYGEFHASVSTDTVDILFKFKNK